jgi:6-phosphogluconolactonase (cycloisomerase 2 family)
VTHDSTGDTVYAVTTSGNGITLFKRDPISGSLAYDSFVSTDSISPDSCEASIDDEYLLAGASSDDRLLLYKIAQ